MTRDILQTSDGDIKLVAGDIVWGEASLQHQRDILLARRGDYRRAPWLGVGLEDWIDDENPEQLLGEISKQFTADGMTIISLSTTNIIAEYQ